MQNKANFPVAKMKAKCRSENGLGEKYAASASAKTKPICPGGGMVGTADPARVAEEALCKTKPIFGACSLGMRIYCAKQSQFQTRCLLIDSTEPIPYYSIWKTW